MKKLLLFIFVFPISVFTFAQEEWSTDQVAVLEKFSLDKNDHRGIALIFQEEIECDTTFITVKDALLSFLTSQTKKDLYRFCISGNSQLNKLDGQTLDLFQITSLYIQLND